PFPGVLMISCRCAGCGKDLKVKDELAGKMVKCPGCGKPVAVPAPVESPAAPSATMSAAGHDPRNLPPREAPAQFADHAHQPPPEQPAARQPPVRPAADLDSSLTDFLAPPQADDELGRLGGYKVLKWLGQGGMGLVFEAEDVKLKRRVALKVMKPEI